MEYKENRETLVDWVKKQLIGLNLKDNGLKQSNINLVGERPLDRVFTGFLFPIVENEEDMDGEAEANGLETEQESEPENDTKLAKKQKRYIPPSSAGFSFYITGKDIKLRVFYDAVFYKKESERDLDNQKYVTGKWNKNLLTDGGREVEFTPNSLKQFKIFDTKAKIDVLWRRYNTGYIVTVTMSNNQRLTDTGDRKKFSQDQNEQTLFEVEFKCIIEQGNVDIYPSKDRALLNEEEQELELRYKDIHIYAVGHGTAVDWAKNTQNQMEIWTDFIPTVEVPQVTADTGGKNAKVLEFSFLKQCSHDKEVIPALTGFIRDYELWIENQQEKAKTEQKEDQETAKKIVQRLSLAKKRMEQGVRLLINDELACISFAIANEAMLEQMRSNDKNTGKARRAPSEYKWRPFQLAFMLMVLDSTTNDDSDYRDTLDLIWFPTGGGKTEAYLGLMAFLFVYRRLKYPASSGGTVSIMRYTLRLLTAQQFLRAIKVISALELIRRKDESRLGKEAFTVGLWVGSASSPNTFNQAEQLVKDKQYSKLILNSCPWCDIKFDGKNYIAKKDAFHFTCHNKNCDFGQLESNVLPCNIVDEALYKKPPSLLIATVDKFARLAWEERAGVFFGVKGNRPPELIIQDELHLISSALGSIVGLYEVAIDTVLISKGMRAKYIASTATIKNAAKQVQTLFARDMLIFPPPGLRYSDAYFAKTVPLEEKPGRMYIGYLAPLLSRQRCLEPLAGVLLSAPNKLFKQQEYLDAWWTQIVYHGSLKGVGNSRTLYQSGIKNYLHKFTFENLKSDIDGEFPGFLQQLNIKQIADFNRIKNEEAISTIEKYLPVRDVNIKTLTSNQSAEENALVFEALATEKDQPGTVDVALATNMISVGLDVTRLALMIINGQPLTTAEYIQASSRVGRGEVPGIVFINYYKTQARSLSHYENFRSYHDTFYRYVEPSSLTPFTYQARTRALHAALVIAIRHSGIGLLANKDANAFDMNNEDIKKVVKVLKIRCKNALKDNNEAIDKINEHIEKLAKEWCSEVKYCEENKIKLVYNSKDKSYSNLLCNFGEKNGKWQTLQSMRNVENSALIKLS